MLRAFILILHDSARFEICIVGVKGRTLIASPLLFEESDPPLQLKEGRGGGDRQYGVSSHININYMLL